MVTSKMREIFCAHVVNHLCPQLLKVVVVVAPHFIVSLVRAPTKPFRVPEQTVILRVDCLSLVITEPQPGKAVENFRTCQELENGCQSV